MTFVQAIVLGLIQGVTEFLPISSSGHLILLPHLFGWGQHALDFDAVVHLGTLFAVVIALRADIADILRSFIGRRGEHTLGWKVVVATAPIVVAGIGLTKTVLNDIRSLEFIAGSLILWGVMLWFADIYAARIKRPVTDVHKISWNQAITIGFSQVIALIPGSSRSGITMTAALFGKIERTAAARFSFLLSIPAIAGGGLVAIFDGVASGFDTDPAILAVGFICAFLSGLFAIQFLFYIVKKFSFKWFALYRILLGIIILLWII